MGSGVLAMPYAFAQGGWGLAIVMFVSLPVLIIYNTLVSDCAHACRF